MRARSFLAIGVLFLLITSSVPISAAEISSVKEEPYLYKPTVPDTAFAVLALYKTGDYARVLEGCEWLMEIRTPFDSWGYAYGEDQEAKYTAMALMALIRSESVARGMYTDTINSAAYWLIYKQSADGSWDDYLDTALAYVALREFLRSRYINSNLTGFEKQVEDAATSARYWLQSHQPRSEVERIFGYMALGKSSELEKMNVSGELSAYRAFALAYLGKHVELDGNFSSPMTVAMALYATGKGKYRDELLRMEHFGFWGELHYRVLDLLLVSRVSGFEDLREAACPYIDQVKSDAEWQKAALANYYVLCNRTPVLPVNYSSLLPWQVAEVTRVKAKLGEDPTPEVEYLLKNSTDGVWRDFYNTEYVLWVFKSLNVNYDYGKSLSYLQNNLTWMLTSRNSKTGRPIYYSIPTYYFAYAVIVFKEFNLEGPLNASLGVLSERQYKNGAWPYTPDSIVGITTTATVLWALQQANLTNLKMYRKGFSFLRESLYARLPLSSRNGTSVSLENATFLLVRKGAYLGNSTSRTEVGGLDGYVVVYPKEHPLYVRSYTVEGFRAESPWRSGGRSNYLVGITLIGALLLAMYGVVWFEHRRKK